MNRSASNFHIFALEHGLDTDEIAEISTQLRSRLKSRKRLNRHWLLWVIYSTEHGYQYMGHEYWPSFETQTPWWDGGNRNQLARWFKRFQDTFDGVVPTGRWANYFRIISRPITHAILPKYLQYQFARALYDSRYHLASLTSLDPGTVGRVLARRADHASTRFEEFLQQEELTGRIVLALLREPSVGTSEPIYPPTLERIVNDLDEVRNARDWLGETRQQVKDRFTGIGRGLRRDGGPLPDRDGPDRGLPQLHVRPKVYLSHRGSGKWVAWADIPSFKSMASLSAEYRSFMRRTRCRLNGSNETKPAGWLLYGNRKGVLKQWPNPREPLISFEQSHPQIDNILQSECRFSEGPIWLFRVGRDGTAPEITGGVVRPGGKYIIVGGTLSDSQFGMRPLDVDCVGIAAHRLDVPNEVTSEFTEWLEGLGLQLARTIRVWPAGFPGRGWDGEGHTEWLTTEAPCFGLVHDHPLDGYVLRFNSDTEFEIEADATGCPVFFQIPRLPAGIHILTVKAKRSSSLDAVVSTPAAEGYVELHVREPEPWVPGVASHSGLVAILDPHDADLDRVWRNEVALSVLGPESRSVSVRVRLKDGTGNAILSETVANDMGLPLRPDAWRARFAQFLKRDKNAWVYLEAASGELEVSAGELGHVSFQFEHEIPPLRWVLRRKNENILARLVDDIGMENSEPEAWFTSMQTPLEENGLSWNEVESGLSVGLPGGLLYARHGDHQDSVVASCGLTGEGLKGLAVSSDYSWFSTNPVVSPNVLRLYAQWHNARRYGPLIDVRCTTIANRLLALILRHICGEKWAQAEQAFRNSPYAGHELEALLRLVERRSTGFSTMLGRERGQWSAHTTDASLWYQELAARYQICTNRRVSEFAVKLGTEAHKVPENFGRETDDLLVNVRENPAVLRGVRFLECSTQLHGRPRSPDD